MTTWNNTNPAVGNQIANDIPDITENFAHIKSALNRLMQETWSDSDVTGIHLDSAVGMYDGTYTFTAPTNGVGADAKFMMGLNTTIIWMYLNAAPPGWKVTATGADTILGVSGGSQAYNINGGTAGGTWTQPGHTLTTAESPAHVHASSGAHAHTFGGATPTYGSGGGDTGMGVKLGGSESLAGSVTIASAGSAHTHTSSGGGGTHQHGTTYRPSASVGKLFQLDTA